MTERINRYGNGDGIFAEAADTAGVKGAASGQCTDCSHQDEEDDEIRDIFEGKSDKLILVIGPCSADNEDAVIDYISRLRTVQEKVADKIFMIPRIYTNKPRTTGIGYKGMLHQRIRSGNRTC